jgi:hypothetical protein
MALPVHPGKAVTYLTQPVIGYSHQPEEGFEKGGGTFLIAARRPLHGRGRL